MNKISISAIRIDGGTQARAEINEAVVGEYADAITEGVNLPPVTVFFDGSAYWLADGFHRYHAHKRIGAIDIDATIINGDRRAAVLHSVGANHSHGLRRSNEDKRRAVMILLEDAEWKKWSQAKIADACSVSREYVSRQFQKADPSCARSHDATRTVERAGKVYEQDTSNIGKRAAEIAKLPEPERAAAVIAPKPVEAKSAMVVDQSAEVEFLTEANAELLFQNRKLEAEVAKLRALRDGQEAIDALVSRLNLQIEQLTVDLAHAVRRRDEEMNKASQAVKDLKFWQRKADRLESKKVAA